MENLQTWYLGLDPTMQVFWGCALLFSAIFLIQAILTIIGMDHQDALEMDFGDADGDTMDVGGAVSLFSIRSLVNFFVGFGWAGVSFGGDIHNRFILYVIAIVIGLCFAYLYIYMRKKLMTLESNGAFKIQDSVGKMCDVYLHIPAIGQGTGKVQISLNGSIHEFDAVSNGDEIPTGAKVKVLSVDGNILTVQPLTPTLSPLRGKGVI